MKATLISTDFVKDSVGNLKPTELNTNTLHHIHAPFELDNSFSDYWNGYFDHERLYQFCTENNIIKIKTIVGSKSMDHHLSNFAEHYGLEFSRIIVSGEPPIIPDVDDEDDTLIIRISYDGYALIDDIYAADNYEFYNLIQSESFSIPTFTNSNSGFNISTIQEVSDSIDENWPNYIKKDRYPNINNSQNPELFCITSSQQLDSVKSGLSENEYLSEFTAHSASISENEGRVSYFRNMSLIFEHDLSVFNLLNIESINDISIDNDKIKHEQFIINDSGSLSKSWGVAFLPFTKYLEPLAFAFDEHDNIALYDGGYVSANELSSNSGSYNLLSADFYEINFMDIEVSSSSVNSFTLVSGSAASVNDTPGESRLFASVTASNPSWGEFSWYDGTSNKHLINYSGSLDRMYLENVGSLVEGDYLYLYDKQSNEHIPFEITSIDYGMRSMNTYQISVSPTSYFYTEIKQDSDIQKPIHILRHNECHPLCHISENPDAPNNQAGICNFNLCRDCSKSAYNLRNCVNCQGNVTPGSPCSN
jgi:hypothetical protein